MSLGMRGAVSPSSVNITRRVAEWVVAMDIEQADNSVLPTAMECYQRGYTSAQAADSQHFVRYSGGGQNVYRIIDQYPCIHVLPSAINVTLLNAFRLVSTQPVAVQFRSAFGSLASPGISPEVPRGFATSIMAWCRKLAGGDSSSAKCCIGFADTTTIGGPGSSSLSPRVGLVGDGAGGYRFGSVNCPDGTVAPAENADNAIDANAFQPQALVAPGTGWFHVWVKMIPPTPENPTGRWEARLNGVLVATFSLLANFPRGNQNVNKNFARLEPVIQNWGGTVAVPPSLVYRDIRLWLEQLEGVA